MRWKEPPVTINTGECDEARRLRQEVLIVKPHDRDSSITEVQVSFVFLEKALYSLRESNPNAITEFEQVCEAHHAEMMDIREAMIKESRTPSSCPQPSYLMGAGIAALGLPFLALSRRQNAAADTVEVTDAQPAPQPA